MASSFFVPEGDLGSQKISAQPVTSEGMALSYKKTPGAVSGASRPEASSRRRSSLSCLLAQSNADRIAIHHCRAVLRGRLERPALGRLEERGVKARVHA